VQQPRVSPTQFQQRVYQLVEKIPAGRVVTYGWLARQLGCNSSRAIGQALRRNPFAPRVPCHRVVGKNRLLTGYQGLTENQSLSRKQNLLSSEGVEFDGDGKVQPHYVIG